MANEEQLSILKQGVEVWNRWLEANIDATVDLQGADLQRANLQSSNLSEANLMDANLNEADLSGANLRGANLTRAQLRGARLFASDLNEADLSGANLRGANLGRADLSGADLVEADLVEADLSGADLVEANLVEANLSGADLVEANLSGARLREGKLSRAKLFGAKLFGVDLSRADLFGADLREAKLSGADFSRADLREADFSRANLREAELREVNLSRAKLFGADLSNSDMFFANFAYLDLSQTKGLEEIEHSGPSTIGTDTLRLSQGKISAAFLRGCGLSDWEIEAAKLYNPDLSNHEINDIQYRMYDLRATQALQISPLFISYSHGDGRFVDKISDALPQRGIRYWRDIHDMKAGRIETQIDRAISQNRTVLLVLSEHSLSSDWVEHEVRTARELEKEMARDVLCPVALDDSWKSSRWPKRVMEQIMEYNILDFSEWKDDSKFDGMFRKLIDGLELFYKG